MATLDTPKDQEKVINQSTGFQHAEKPVSANKVCQKSPAFWDESNTITFNFCC